MVLGCRDGAKAVGVRDGIVRWHKKMKNYCSAIGDTPHGALWLAEQYSTKVPFVTREGKSLGSVDLPDKQSNGSPNQMLFVDETTAFAMYHSNLTLIVGKAL
ncbi:MAG: hypothetical protein GY811_06730 [Myxococcales bacterium]|nr:hypothetical protein [Myxococcales bacterium]